MLVLITYDLKQPERNYDTMYEAIKQCGTAWWHYLESVWIVNTHSTPQECYNRIKPNMDDNDYLFIVDITKQNRQGWLPTKAWEWLKENDDK